MSDHKDETMEVIPAAEIKEAFDALKGDHAELKRQMASDKEATGMAIEERAGDLQKAVDAVEDHSKRLEDIDKKVAQNAYVAGFGQDNGELKDALQSYQAGFSAFDGDNEAKEYGIGSKPQLKHIIEGVFTGSGDESSVFHSPKHIMIDRLQKAADDVYIVDACLRAQMGSSELQAYAENGGARGTKTYKRFQNIAGNFQKAVGDLIDTVTEVVNWIPTQYSSQLYEQVKIGLPLVNMFPEVSMQAATVVLPLDMNDNEATRVTETVTLGAAGAGAPWLDATFVNPAALSSGKITLVAEKLRSRYWISMEATEDAIVAMLPFLNRKHRRNMGEALEDAILNGQVSGLDTGGTHFSKTNPSAATDARDCWDGLRQRASVYTPTPVTSVDNSNGKPTVVGIRGIRAAMGEYGVTPSDLAYIFGIFGYIKLLDDTNVMTLDKLGVNATVRTGTMAQVDGVDVVISRRMPENANASGLIDGVTENRTLAVVVHRDSFILGNRRRITLDSQKWVASDSQELVAFWRGDFQPVYNSILVPHVGLLYNIIGA